MSKNYTFLERFIRFHGDAEQVKKIIEDCKGCGAKLIHSYHSNHLALSLEELALCPECGKEDTNLVYPLN